MTTRGGSPARRFDRVLVGLAWGCGFFAAAAGAVHLGAWLFLGPETLQAWTGPIFMKTNAALALLLSGAALLWLLPVRAAPWRRGAGIACAAAVVLVSGATFSQHLCGWNLGIDQLLASEPPHAAAVTSPNRMGPPASLNFTLLGLALLLFARPQDKRSLFIEQALALAVAVLALLPTLGYLYGASELYGIARYTGIAWPTALASLLLAIGLLCARPTSGIMAAVTADDPGGRAIRRMWPPLLALPLVLGWLRVEGERYGLFDAAVGTSLMMLVCIVLATALVFYTARGANLAAAALRAGEERTRLSAEVTSELLFSPRPQEVVEALCRKVMAHLDCHAFFNYLVDEPSGRLHLNACAGVPDETVRAIEWLDIGSAVCGCAARDRSRIIAEDIQHSHDSRSDLVRSLGIQAYACHPLLNQRQVIGTLSFGARNRTSFTDDELDLMKAVTDHVSIAMQRLRLLETLEQHAAAAEAANVAKSRFLANMSHELRTPMNAILGMVDLALPKATDPVVRDCLATAKGSADLLLTLLDDLLDSAKIEAGKLELEAAPFSLRRMLNQLTRILAVRASEKGLCYSCRLPADLPDAVVGDRTRLQQVLLNLAGNAIKFTERGEVEVEVRARVDGGRAQLEFAVRDTGIGIAPERLPALFAPFAQADASMTRRFGGTGLGLSICKSLVELMDGTITAQSRPGEGSTFSFAVCLPLTDAVPAEHELAVVAAPQRPLRVLLVEDNPANQKLARYILLDRGHVVEMANDGREALELSARYQYDVILMDAQMPNMDGLEATAAIRKRENGGGRVPIVAMTAHAHPEDRARCLAAGMDAYLSKPINAQQMVAVVESLAGGVPAASATAAVAPPSAESAVFNRHEALAACCDSESTLAEMIECFDDEVALLLPQMREALARGDLVSIGRLGHRLKGTLVYLGAPPAQQAARRVEDFARNGGTVDAAATAVAALEHACQALQAALGARAAVTEA